MSNALLERARQPGAHIRRRLEEATPHELLPVEARDDLDAAGDLDAYALELLEAGEYAGAAAALGSADLWRVLAVASFLRWAALRPLSDVVPNKTVENDRTGASLGR